MTDSKTLETIVDAFSKQTSFIDRKPIVVMDAEIATNENLIMLREKHYDYICVTCNKLKDYEVRASTN